MHLASKPRHDWASAKSGPPGRVQLRKISLQSSLIQGNSAETGLVQTTPTAKNVNEIRHLSVPDFLCAGTLEFDC